MNFLFFYFFRIFRQSGILWYFGEGKIFLYFLLFLWFLTRNAIKITFKITFSAAFYFWWFFSLILLLIQITVIVIVKILLFFFFIIFKYNFMILLIKITNFLVLRLNWGLKLYIKILFNLLKLYLLPIGLLWVLLLLLFIIFLYTFALIIYADLLPNILLIYIILNIISLFLLQL